MVISAAVSACPTCRIRSRVAASGGFVGASRSSTMSLNGIVKLTLSERTYRVELTSFCSHRTAQVTSCQTMKARSRSSR